MKKVTCFVIIPMLLFCFVLSGCTEDKQNEQNIFKAYKYYSNPDDGLGYSQTKVTFTGETLTAVEYLLLFNTEKQAQEYYDVLVATTAEFPEYDWQTEGKQVTGREFDLTQWEGQSFTDMKKLFTDDGWEIE